jgi:hypothetical protein
MDFRVGRSSRPTSIHSDEIGQLKQAIDTNDLARVKNLMIRNPELHRAPLGYSKNGPLTWVAECRVPWEPPSPARLAMEWRFPDYLRALRGSRQHDRLAEQLDADSTLLHRRFPELDRGSTGGRRLLLQGATLLHVAAEFG